MVSACILYLDEIDLIEQKRFVPDVLSALFQESDRIETPDPDGGEPTIEYRAHRQSILKRLDMMGCTTALAQRRFEEWRKNQIQDQKRYLADEEPDRETELNNELKALSNLTWDEWRRRVPDVLSRLDEFDTHVDETDRHMKSFDECSWLWFDGIDSLISIRAIIGAALDTEEIVLDVGSLIGNGWIKETTKICTEKIRIVASQGQPAGPAIILAEGKSDIAILKGSLERFHPDLTEFVTFLNHSEFKVDGGASFMVKFLKAFAAARVPSNIVAVFDNDAAGLVAYRQAQSISLPNNMACIHLPDIELARAYPTIGPQGQHDSDINGRACGIELYLGKSALSANGSLRPVRWTGYDKRGDTYQGEVDQKEAVQEAFLTTMRDGVGDPELEYPEMQLVWQTILEAIALTAENAQKQGRPPPEL